MMDLSTLRKFPLGTTKLIEGTMGAVKATLVAIEGREDGDHYKIRTESPFGKTINTQEFTQSHLWFWSRGYMPEPLVCSMCATDKNVRVFPRKNAPFGWQPMCVPDKAKALREQS